MPTKKMSPSFEDIVDQLPALVLLQRQEIVTYINEYGVELLGGQSQDDFLGRSVWELIHPDEHRRIRARLRKLQNGEKLQPIEVRLRKLNQGYIACETVGFTTGENSGTIGRLAVSLTRTKEAEQKLLAEVEKRQANEARLQSVIRDLRAFSYTVAHELKAPITLIRGYTSIMLEDLLTSQVMRYDGTEISGAITQILDTIIVTVKRMQTIIDELLLLAEISRGAAPQQVVEMKPIIDDVTARLSFRISAAGAIINAPERWPPAYGYRPWIEEVWINLIENAIKYGGSPPLIELGCTQFADTNQYWCKDNGQGIPPEAQSQLWAEGFRMDEHTHIRGTGLGLGIVKSIIEKLGGMVGVESTPGEGARFYFSLKRIK